MEQLEITAATDTIGAIATPAGTGGIAVIRVSGPDAIRIVDSAWCGRRLDGIPSHTAHLGKYISTDGNILDEGVTTVFRSPSSFTGEDVVEISLHGSRWIQREVLNDLLKRGARIAGPGEFTQRAFMNGKLDLAQAEGVADLIAASSRAAHSLAMSQTRGHFSRELDNLREKLIEFASLLELELDFSEEDVEFADRSNLLDLAETILCKINTLSASYSSGAVIKDGVPVVIAGIPNAGKSSLLNLLLGDDKAIVSDIPGTTRDTIEDTLEINGILFRFTDTAGLRDTSDTIEKMGIDRARDKMRNARAVIWIIDPTAPLSPQIEELNRFNDAHPSVKAIIIINKSDMVTDSIILETESLIRDKCRKDTESENLTTEIIPFSAMTRRGSDLLINQLIATTTNDLDINNHLIVTNSRHYEALMHGSDSLRRAIDAIKNGITADFISQDIRETLHHLGTITGTITTDTLLHSIFSRFCIGK